MLFYKPLVSLVTAMALAGTVTASATPVRRTDPQCQAQNQNLYCCTEGGPLSTLSAPVKVLGALLGLDLSTVVAAGCVLNVLWYAMGLQLAVPVARSSMALSTFPLDAPSY
ncbi:hypothetical protein H4582DRAFT_1982926, partial [Lactarius indigo]